MENVTEEIKKKGDRILKGVANKLKKPKVWAIIFAIWYIETPIVITFSEGFFKVNLLGLYCNPINVLLTFIHHLSIILGVIKFNIFLFIIILIVFSLMHVSGKSTGKILDVDNFKMLFKLLEKEEGEIKFSDRGDYGTAKWATESEIQKVNRSGYKPYVKISNDGKEGLIMGYLHGTKKLLTLPKETMLNRNFAVYGSSGSMKSRSFVIPNILNLILNGESMFITDPKGELLGKTSKILDKYGYKVRAFNINNVPCSDRWNVLDEIKDEQSASIFAKSIIQNTKDRGDKLDAFWDTHYINFLKAIALYVKDDPNVNNRNMARVYELVTYNEGFAGLDSLFSGIPVTHPAYKSWQTFKTAAGNEKVSSGVMSGLAIKLDSLQIPLFRDLLSGNDIDLTAPGKEKCAYFVIVPDTHATFNFLAGLFFTFAFIDLIEFADKLGDALPTHVNFLLDEFPNIAAIPDFEKKISTVRSRGVSICVIFQALSQLSSRYSPDIAEEILANCDNQIFLGANEMGTSKHISEMLGDATIEVETESMGGGIFDFGVDKKSKGLAKRRLRNPDEVLRKAKEESYVMLNGIHPIRADKMDYSKHALAPEMEEVSIYAQLKDWSIKYHEKYLVEIKEQLEKALDKYIVIQNELDKSKIKGEKRDEALRDMIDKANKESMSNYVMDKYEADKEIEKLELDLEAGLITEEEKSLKIKKIEETRENLNDKTFVAIPKEDGSAQKMKKSLDEVNEILKNYYEKVKEAENKELNLIELYNEKFKSNNEKDLEEISKLKIRDMNISEENKEKLIILKEEANKKLIQIRKEKEIKYFNEKIIEIEDLINENNLDKAKIILNEISELDNDISEKDKIEKLYKKLNDKSENNFYKKEKLEFNIDNENETKNDISNKLKEIEENEETINKKDEFKDKSENEQQKNNNLSNENTKNENKRNKNESNLNEIQKNTQFNNEMLNKNKESGSVAKIYKNETMEVNKNTEHMSYTNNNRKKIIMDTGDEFGSNDENVSEFENLDL
ncbi:VirD4-like conjugal transfer protein, CD1115 family [Clostridium thermobutyricum]|uniref:VirD4-like conjugal transfer protein, CD1115 family n=1 Tax=Clostridium thermobutyricum TaxID=29372 RepID=UPI0018A9831A|nr:type IV secretory system conjugative DNA transfer family protein [Clostridium thermobutyricum]